MSSGTNGLFIPSNDGHITFLEKAAPTNIAGRSVLYMDSTAHELRCKMNDNNAVALTGSANPIVLSEIAEPANPPNTASIYMDEDDQFLKFKMHDDNALTFVYTNENSKVPEFVEIDGYLSLAEIAEPEGKAGEAIIYMDSTDNDLRCKVNDDNVKKIILSNATNDVTIGRHLSVTGNLLVDGDSGVGGTLTVTGACIVNGGVKYTLAADPGAGATPIALDAVAGTVTFSGVTTAGLASGNVVINNDNVSATSIVFANISTYAGAGDPVIKKIICGADTITISLLNTHATDAMNADISIQFVVFAT